MRLACYGSGRKEVTASAHQPVPVDVRVISATHCKLDMQQGRFRRIRFIGLRLQLPPLRERVADIRWQSFESVSGGALRPVFCRIPRIRQAKPCWCTTTGQVIS
ncbi:hypothetical protein ACVXHA_20665 [Escherichia coli]